MTSPPVGGVVDTAFASVRTAFEETLRHQPGTGAGVAVWHDGRWVVDLYGGWADARHTRPWRSDTLVMPYSVTKTFAAACVLLLADRRAVELDEPIQAYWPELRAETTLRQVLGHRSGVVALDEDVPEDLFYDWDGLCALVEAQAPAWPPGTAQGESALLYGHLLGEVVRRVDGRSLGAFLREEVCRPHGLDFHIGLGPGELGRVADLTGFDDAFRARAEQDRPPLFRRALLNPPGALDERVVNSERWRMAEIPAVNGHGTARSVAALYVALERGRLLGPGTLEQVKAAGPPEEELVIGGRQRWGLGFAVEDDGYGMGGVGGSYGWWSEAGQYAFGYVTAHVGDLDRGDRLENQVRSVLGLAPL
jgi:CubicO group peptidase (beta-lactamase class C family)